MYMNNRVDEKVPMMSNNAYKLRGLLRSFSHRLQSGNNLAPTDIYGSFQVLYMLRQKDHYYSMHRQLKLYNSSGYQSWRSEAKINRLRNQSVDVAPIKPDDKETQYTVHINFGWVKSLFGFVIALLLPSWKEKWQQLKMIEGEAEMVIQGVEKMAEGVEKVAMVAEEISTEATEKLSDQSNIKKAAMVIEHISTEVVCDAQKTIDFIHKVDVMKQDLDDLESTVEKFIQKDSN